MRRVAVELAAGAAGDDSIAAVAAGRAHQHRSGRDPRPLNGLSLDVSGCRRHEWLSIIDAAVKADVMAEVVAKRLPKVKPNHSAKVFVLQITYTQ